MEPDAPSAGIMSQSSVDRCQILETTAQSTAVGLYRIMRNAVLQGRASAKLSGHWNPVSLPPDDRALADALIVSLGTLFGKVTQTYASTCFARGLETGDLRSLKIRFLLMHARQGLLGSACWGLMGEHLEALIAAAEAEAGCTPDPSPRRLSHKEQEAKRLRDARQNPFRKKNKQTGDKKTQKRSNQTGDLGAGESAPEAKNPSGSPRPVLAPKSPSHVRPSSVTPKAPHRLKVGESVEPADLSDPDAFAAQIEAIETRGLVEADPDEQDEDDDDLDTEDRPGKNGEAYDLGSYRYKSDFGTYDETGCNFSTDDEA